MFKIIEHDDGSSTVYCNYSGRVICSVPKKRDKPLGIGRPIPREVEPSAVVPMRPMPTELNAPYTSSYGLSSPLSPLQCTVRPLAWINKSDGILTEKCMFKSENDLILDEDIQEDCISQPEFLQTLGLCPQHLKDKGEWKSLRQELPTRLIARTSPKDQFYIHPESKVYEECDLVSPLGQKWLNCPADGPSRLIDSDMVASSIKKYETFCRFALGSLYLSGTAAPYSMRCREIKKYISTYKPVKVRTLFHKYCFNSSQRHERKRFLETGLNKRARELLRTSMSKKKLTVSLKRLSKEQIAKLTARVTPKTILDRRLAVFKKSMHDSELIKDRDLSLANSLGYSLRKCSVNVEDISEKLKFNSDGVLFIQDTKTKVNNSLPSSDAHTSVDTPTFQHHDHAYHRIQEATHSPNQLHPHMSGIFNYSRKVSEHPSVSIIRNEYPKITMLKNKTAKPSSFTIMPKTSINSSMTITKRDIPLIDLSLDDDDEIPSRPSPLPPSSPFNDEFTHIVFRCYGCNFNKSYGVKKDGTQAIKDHMKIYHLVSQPNAFLSVQLEKSRNTAYVEAFPGYMR